MSVQLYFICIIINVSTFHWCPLLFIVIIPPAIYDYITTISKSWLWRNSLYLSPQLNKTYKNNIRHDTELVFLSLWSNVHICLTLPCFPSGIQQRALSLKLKKCKMVRRYYTLVAYMSGSVWLLIIFII